MDTMIPIVLSALSVTFLRRLSMSGASACVRVNLSSTKYVVPDTVIEPSICLPATTYGRRFVTSKRSMRS